MSYRIGIVGGGGQGKAHAQEWAQLDNCEVVAIADPLPAVVDTFRELYPGLRDYPSYDAMIEACERNDVALVISHNRRNDPRYFKLRQLLDDGLIGKLCRVHAADKGYEVGYGLMNIGTHIFDGLRMILGDVQKVFAHLTVDGRDLTPDDITTDGPRGTGWVAGKEGTVILHFKLTTAPELRPVASETWRELIKRVWLVLRSGGLLRRVAEVDPLLCPQCGREMGKIAVIKAPVDISAILRQLSYVGARLKKY